MTSHDRWVIYQVTGRKPKAPRRSPRRRMGGRGPVRNSKYMAWIRTLPSAVSGRMDCIDGKVRCEAAHTGSDGGMKQKASDLTCIPLTIEEHREYHQIGKPAFEELYGISCTDLVKRLNHAWFAYSDLVK